MHVERLDEVTLDDLAAILTMLDERPDVLSSLVMIAEDGAPPADALSEVFRRASIPTFGGVFPQLIDGGLAHPRGAIIVGIPAASHTAVVRGVSGDPSGFEDKVAQALGDADPSGRTVFVFFDATSGHVDALLSALFEEVGLLGTYLGGGAGSLSFERIPCVVTPEGLLEDAALIAVTDLPSVVGVAHGWEPISLPLQVTASNGRSVEAIDHEPAAPIYESLVRAHGGGEQIEDPFALAGSYPLGIMQLDGEVVVRDPVVKQGDHLLCVGEVPAGAYVQLLYGDESSLLQAAERAARLARAGDPISDEQLGVVFDCISRVLYLGERFARELALIDLGLPMVGAATIGEVCSPGDRYLELYNKTVVAARLGAVARGNDD